MDGIVESENNINRFSMDAFMTLTLRQLLVKMPFGLLLFISEVKIHFTVIEIAAWKTAFVRGAFTVTNPADTLLDKGKFLSIWKKFPDDKWLMTHDIFNSDLPAPVAKEDTGQNK
jgi:hypothetical protein